jgi:hypothetical protein
MRGIPARRLAVCVATLALVFASPAARAESPDPATSFAVLLSGGTKDHADPSPFYDFHDAAFQFDGMQLAVRARIQLAPGTAGPLRNVTVSATLDGSPLTVHFLGTDTDADGAIDLIPDARFPELPYVDVLLVTPGPLPDAVAEAQLAVVVATSTDVVEMSLKTRHDTAKNSVNNIRFAPPADGFGFANAASADYASVQDHFGTDRPSLLFYMALRSFGGRSLGMAGASAAMFVHPSLKPDPDLPLSSVPDDSTTRQVIDELSFAQRVMALSASIEDADPATEIQLALSEVDAGRPVVLLLGGAETAETVPILAARRAFVVGGYTALGDPGTIWLHGGDPDRPLVWSSARYDIETQAFHYGGIDADSVIFTRFAALTVDEILAPRTTDDALDLASGWDLLTLAAIEERKKLYVNQFGCSEMDMVLSDDTGDLAAYYATGETAEFSGGVRVATGDVNGDGTCTVALLVPAIQKIRASTQGHGDTEWRFEAYLPLENGRMDVAVSPPVALSLGSKATYDDDAAGGIGTSVLLDADGDGEVDLTFPLGRTTVGTDPGREVPEDHALDQNYPNPFNPMTTIPVRLDRAGEARLDVFDLTGRRVRTLHAGLLPAGPLEFRFDAGSLPSGIYLYRLQTASGTAARSMALIR